MKMMTNTATKIVSAALTTCLCASAIVGATYALLTDEAEVNIAVTSGKVAVTATVDESSFTCYSVQKNDSTEEFTDVKQEGNTFYCGGTVGWDAVNATLSIDKMAAGDKVTFDITVTNTSTIDILYQLSLAQSDGDGGTLFEKLEVSAVCDGVEIADTYALWQAPTAEEGETKTISVTVGLPVTYTNSETESAALKFSVTAIQSNGLLTGDNEGEETVKADFARDFTTENQDGAWKYGAVAYQWASEGESESESFTFTQSETFVGDEWTADGVEIKAGWINASNMLAVAYTAEEDGEVKVTLKFTGTTEEATKLALRVGIKNSEDELYGNPTFVGVDNTFTLNATYTLNAGDTIYFIFGNENSATPSGDLSIIIA